MCKLNAKLLLLHEVVSGAFGCRIVTVLQYVITRLHFFLNIEENDFVIAIICRVSSNEILA